VFGAVSNLEAIYVPAGSEAAYRTFLGTKNPDYSSLVQAGPPTYTLTINVGDKGKAKVNGVNYTSTLTFDMDDVVNIQFIPMSGYKISNVSGIASPYKIDGINDNYTISVEFEKKPTAKIGRLNIKQGKVHIKPRE